MPLVSQLPRPLPDGIEGRVEEVLVNHPQQIDVAPTDSCQRDEREIDSRRHCATIANAGGPAQSSHVSLASPRFELS